MEPDTNVGEEGATGSEGAASSNASTNTLTVEAIRDMLMPLIDERVGQHVAASTNNLYRGIQGVMDSTVKQIADQFGVDREAAIAMKEAAAATLGEEAMAGISERAKREAAEKRIAVLEASKVVPQDGGGSEIERRYPAIAADLADECKGLGVDFLEVRDRVKMTIRHVDEYPRWQREFRKQMVAMADANRKIEEGGKTNLDTTKGSGSAPNLTWDQIQKITDPKELARIPAETWKKYGVG